MAGHIAGLGYSVRNDLNGVPLGGWTLTVYTGGTSTPASVYSDYALAVALTNPIVADANGMLPMFWVADGTYRVRGLTPQGVELFDDDGIVALGPSSGSGGGGSGVDANALFDTGDFMWRPVAGTKTGWVRANARTIGSAASGATERSNSDCEDLFLFLWNNFSDTLCPVTGGRGGSAAADWAANKVIATPDMRGKSPFGLDDMGNSAAGVIAAGTPTAVSAGGAETVSITIGQTNLPSVNLSHSLSVGTSLNNGTNVVRGTGLNDNDDAGSGTQGVDGGSITTLSLASGTVSGTVSLGGSGTALTPNKMPPYYLGTWHVKL